MSRGAKPYFTAFVVAQSQLALKKQDRWQTLVPEPSAAIYERCVRVCIKRDFTLFLLSLIPDVLKLRIIERATAFGFAQHIALRKQAIEVQARSDITRGVKQVVVIGAGFDALCVRLAREFPEVSFFELDLPASQARKAEALKLLEQPLPDNLHLVACDLSAQELDEVLRARPPFAPNDATLFIAEGLTMYLTEEENCRWLMAAQRASSDTRILFTAIETTQGANRAGQAVRDGFLKQNDSRYRWSLPRAVMEPFLQNVGYRLKHAREFAELQRSFRSDEEYAKLKRQPGEHVYYAAAFENPARASSAG